MGIHKILVNLTTNDIQGAINKFLFRKEGFLKHIVTSFSDGYPNTNEPAACCV